MGRKKEFARNTAILMVGKLCTQFISFFLLPLYTALLSTEEYGIYDLLITYSTLLLPLVNWQFDQGLFRFMLDCRGNKQEQRSLFSTLFCSSTMQSLIYIILFISIRPILNIDNSFFLLVYVVLHVYTSLLLQFLRGIGENTKYTIASIISALATIVLNVVMLVIFGWGLQGLLISTLGAQIITLVYLIFESKCWEYISLKSIQFKIFRQVSEYSIPLIPNNLAWWVVSVSDRTIISYFLGVSANGIYSVANKFSGVFINFYSVFNLSFTETVSLHFDDEDRDEFLSETITLLFKFFSSICFGIVACMPFVFSSLVNERYSGAYEHIPILMYAMLFRVLVGLYSCVYVAQKNAKKIATTSIATAVINIIVNLVLINKIEIFAASISTLVSFVLMFIIRYIDINRIACIRIKKSVVIGNVLIGVLLAFAYYSKNMLLQIIVLGIISGYAIVCNLNILKAGINIVRGKFRKY